MAVYITMKKKVEQDVHNELVPVSVNMIKSRILVDFSFYKAAGDLEDVLCSVTNRELVYAYYLV